MGNVARTRREKQCTLLLWRLEKYHLPTCLAVIWPIYNTHSSSSC